VDAVRPFLSILILLAAALLTGRAFAHASLLSVIPSDGTTVAAAPSSLSLKFNEQVAPVTLKLIAPDGRSVPLTPDVNGPSLNMPAPAGLGDGTYALSWRVISADGHPVGGTTTFSIGAPSSGGAPQERAIIDWPVRVGIWASRVLTYAGLFIGVGGIFFLRWFGDGAAGLCAARVATIIGLAALVCSVGFQGLDVTDQSLDNLLSPQTWQEGMASSFGLFAGIVLVGLALALVATARVGYERLWSLLGFLCVGLSLAMTGHASTADPQWLTRPAVFLHTSVVAFWVGSLIPLGVLLRGPAEAAVKPLRRFSATIPALLLLLLAAGVALAIVQLGVPGELLGTDYGHVFIAKMAFVVVLLGLAAFNRWGLTGSVLADAGAARNHLVRSIGIELGLVLVIFGIVALWRFTPPPRALLEAAAQPASLEPMSSEGMAEVIISPGHAGPVKVDISVMGPNMGPLAAQGVTVDFSNKDEGIEPIEREAKLRPDGSWHIDDLTLPAGGLWQIELDILVSDFKEIDLSDQVDIRP
jgi:copper transport protein